MSSVRDPTVRSRTLLFLSYRDSAVRSSFPPKPARRNKGKSRATEEELSLLEKGGDDVDEDDEDNGMASLPPQWSV